MRAVFIDPPTPASPWTDFDRFWKTIAAMPEADQDHPTVASAKRFATMAAETKRENEAAQSTPEGRAQAARKVQEITASLRKPVTKTASPKRPARRNAS